MRASEDVPVHHLVVDTGGFIKNAKIIDIGAVIYTISEVISEIKDKATRQRLECLPYTLNLKQPSQESLKNVTEISKKTGDYSSLSLTDLKVIALTHDLHIEHCGSAGINYDVKPNIQTVERQSQKLDANLPGFHDRQKEASADDEDSEDEYDSEEDDEGWVNEENFQEVVGNSEHGEVKNEKMTVACLSTDFAIQNVLLHMKLNLVSVDGMRIQKLQTYILRCRACFNTTPIMTKQFCPKCGNKTLHRVAVTVDENGETQLHVNWERLRVKRGLRYSLPTPKGGKHTVQEQLFEDQRMPQNRLAKVIENPLEDGPFSLNDVTSRSAVLGIRSLHRPRPRNPNAPAKGRKRGGKRR
uniref:RNA-binding protein NOB1 n=1 Tax=Acrobeloides nanus TaxID=290746 RepID=A0A914D4Q9_9BILA